MLQPDLIQTSTKFTNTVILNEQKKICSKCLAVNDSDAPICKRCKNKFEEGAGNEKLIIPADTKMQESVILCLNCDEYNFSWKSNCTKCGTVLNVEQFFAPKDGEDPLSELFINCRFCNHKCSLRAIRCPKCDSEIQKTQSCIICSNKIPANSKSCPECGDPEPFGLPDGARQPCPIKSVEIKKFSRSSNKIEAEIETATVGGAFPWRRFWARNVDILTLGVLQYFCICMTFARFAPEVYINVLRYLENPMVAGVLLYLFWLPTEAVLISVFTATPAKWLYGIKIESKSGENLDFFKALERSFLVFIKGEGAAIPLITLFTRIAAYRSLSQNKVTSWDEQVSAEVICKTMGPVRIISCFVVTVIAFAAVSILSKV